MNFEEFIIVNGFTKNDPDDRIHIYNMKVAWNAALKEGRKQGLEEAAGIVDSCEYMSACNMDIAKEIRALVNETP